MHQHSLTQFWLCEFFKPLLTFQVQPVVDEEFGSVAPCRRWLLKFRWGKPRRYLRLFAAVSSVSPFANRYSPFAVHHSLVANRQSPLFRLGRSLDLPNFRRLKSALSFCVTNYGLKSVAWFVFGCVINYRLKPVALTSYFPPMKRRRNL